MIEAYVACKQARATSAGSGTGWAPAARASVAAKQSAGEGARGRVEGGGGGGEHNGSWMKRNRAQWRVVVIKRSPSLFY